MKIRECILHKCKTTKNSSSSGKTAMRDALYASYTCGSTARNGHRSCLIRRQKRGQARLSLCDGEPCNHYVGRVTRDGESSVTLRLGFSLENHACLRTTSVCSYDPTRYTCLMSVRRARAASISQHRCICFLMRNTRPLNTTLDTIL